MKSVETVHRDWLLVLIILPLGILIMLLVGGMATRLSPEWSYAADMISYLDPDSDYLTQRGNMPVPPVQDEILTPPGWMDVLLTPNATYPTRPSSPTPRPTDTPSPSPTEIPATPTFTPSPTKTVRYPTLTFTPSATPTGLTPSRTPTPTSTPTATQTRYTLTINIIGNGSVTRNPNQATYVAGTNVQLTAIPAPGWAFTGWSGNLGGSANPTTILMNGNKTVTATFTQIEYTLAINIVGNGTVTKNPNRATYHYGDVVQLTANPNTGWAFAGWSGDLGGPANPNTILINGNKTVTATFSQIEYTLAINIVGNGTVTKNPNQATYHYGDVVQLSANPNLGWIFTGWSGDLSGSVNPTNILINGNKTVTATFTQIQYTLTINIIGGGTVARNPSQVTYPAGTSVMVTANPNTGWVFDSWSGDLSGSANPETILMDSDKTVTATFTAIEYTLTITLVGNGIVTPNPNQATYHYGDVVQLTANADPNWLFDSWSGDLNSTTNPDNITITGNMAITVTFIPDTTEPDIGQPDGNLREMADGEILVIDLGTTIDVSGGPEPAPDFVYYEYAAVPGPTGYIENDWIILQISTDGNTWYTIFYWGDGAAETHTNIGGYPENDNEPIPLSILYGSFPNKTGIAIDVDAAPGVAVPGVLTNTIPGPVPAGSYRYLRIYAPPGGSNDGAHIDSVDVLP